MLRKGKRSSFVPPRRSTQPCPSQLEQPSSSSSSASQSIPKGKENHPPRAPPSTSRAPPSLLELNVKDKLKGKEDKEKGKEGKEKDVQDRQAFVVLHTKRSNKKRKTYDDGVIILENGKAILYDMEGKVVSRTRFQLKPGEKMVPGSSLDFPGKETEIVDQVDIAKFDSGRLFLSSSSSSALHEAPKQSPSVKKMRKTLCKPFKTVVQDPNGDNNSSAGRRKRPDPLYPEDKENSFVLFHGMEESGTVSCVVDPYLARKLRPHQREGVQFLFDCVTGKGKDAEEFRSGRNKTQMCSEGPRGCILADEMGLGKTLQTITLIWSLLKQGPFGTINPWCYKCVVVTPSSLVKNWAAEFRKWLGREKIEPIVISSGGESAKNFVQDFAKTKVHRVLILSYEMYRKYHKELNAIHRLDLIVCDEGHRLKSAQGNQTINALKGCPTKRRVLLTGTPVQNELNEFFAMVDFVNPGALGFDVRSFQRVFQTPIEKGTDKSATTLDREIASARASELQRLTEAFILRRTAEINEKFLPPRTDINVFVRLGEEQCKVYKEAVQSLLGSTNASGTDALKLIHRLRQVCVHTDLVTKDAESQDPLQLSHTSSGKLFLLDAFLQCIKSLDDKDKVVLVSNSTKTLNLIETLCRSRSHSFLRLDGSINTSDRQNLVNRFNATTKGQHTFLFLLSAKAGGCGLNLIGANRLVLFDLDWNPATDQQAAARIWRDGQQKPVFIYRFISTGTIEERIFQRQQMKMDSAHGIVLASQKKRGSKDNQPKSRGSSVQLGSFSKQELKRLFDLNEHTRCDTYDLVKAKRLGPSEGDESDIEDHEGEETLAAKEWQEYRGPADIPDEAMQRAAQDVGDSVVTWVFVRDNKTTDKDLIQEREEENEDGVVDEDSNKWVPESDEDEELLLDHEKARQTSLDVEMKDDMASDGGADGLEEEEYEFTF